MPQHFRIASLVPSLTETLFDLGLGQHIVARTGFCIHPLGQVESVPKVGGTKAVNITKLAALKPSHVLLNRDENTLDSLRSIELFEPKPQIIATHPLAPLDNLAVFRELGEAFDVRPAAEHLCDQFQKAYDTVLATQWSTKRILYLIWQSPWMSVASNTYISQTLALLGLHTYPPIQGQNVGASRYPVINKLNECVKLHAIDFILLSTEPYSFNTQHCLDLQAQLGIPVYLINGESTSWYGSRSITALPSLAAWRKSVIQGI